MKNFNRVQAKLFLTNADAGIAEAFDHLIHSGSSVKNKFCPILDVMGEPLTLHLQKSPSGCCSAKSS